MTPSTSRHSFPAELPDEYDVTKFGRNVREPAVARPLLLAWSALVVLVGLVVLGYFFIGVLGFRG